jgi:membrane associated rhomboid family serine protease
VPKKQKRNFLDAVEISASILLAIFAVFYLNRFLGGGLNRFGILPRTAWGLMGIVFSPLLHANEAHLMANAISLFFLLCILFAHREYQPDRTFPVIWILTGIGTWLIGRGPFVHIGASGVIYGLITYLIAAGWWMRTWKAALWAALILFLYGGVFHGLLPRAGFVSWGAHLSGAIAGILVARSQHS